MYTYVFGEGEHLTPLQMSARALIMFFATMLFVRLGGRRTLGKKSAYDMVITIVLGAVTARGIVGASPFVSTMAAGAVLAITHRVTGWLITKSHKLEQWVKGNKLLLYDNGEIKQRNMLEACMTLNDLYESMRLENKTNSLDEVDKAYMETNGRISFVLKKHR